MSLSSSSHSYSFQGCLPRGNKRNNIPENHMKLALTCPKENFESPSHHNRQRKQILAHPHKEILTSLLGYNLYEHKDRAQTE